VGHSWDPEGDAEQGEGVVAMDEFDGFFDATESAPGFEDEDANAGLDAGRLNLIVGAGNVGAAAEGSEDAARLATTIAYCRIFCVPEVFFKFKK
jgi:hypothetical protein